MPLYPYLCTQCGHRFEKIQKFGAEPETACPKCGGVLERPLTAPGLNFKGAGWYVNDYASKSSSSSSAAESAATDKKSDAKADAKTESGAKTESKTASGGESGSSSSATSAPATSSKAADK